MSVDEKAISDDELNRRCAEAEGWTCEKNANEQYVLRDPNGMFYGQSPSEDFTWRLLPDRIKCATDLTTAWAFAERRLPKASILIAKRVGLPMASIVPENTREVFNRLDTTPARALCLAVLAAEGKVRG